VDELDDMNRRELLRLLSVTGTLVALPPVEDASADDSAVHLAETTDVEQYEALNTHLWQVFSLSTSKRLVYPLVRQQLGLLTEALERSHSQAMHQRLCILAGDLFQLAGEICFDGNRYTDAAHCYTLAATASKEATAYDLWACALTRHAFIGLYERRFADITSMLAAASSIAAHGDSSLATRYWVAAVQAEAYAGLGDFTACTRALDRAEAVSALGGQITQSGWLRFDGSRLPEERGTCYISLGRPELAEAALSEALDQGISLRRRGSVLSDLAMLGIQRRDVEQIVHYGGIAVELAMQTGSSGYIGRKLDGLQLKLRPLLSDARVANLNGQIGQLSR
jgi:tetratricopeptide (TPR) repeat protein